VKVLALDLGASGGKILLGSFDGKKIAIEEIHRFQNGPVLREGHLTWAVDLIYGQLQEGLTIAAHHEFASFGVDSFCNDYVLLDTNGEMIPPVYMYRDHRTEGIQPTIDKILSPDELYNRTGNQQARFNALVQLVSETRGEDRRLDHAQNLLFLSDYLHFRLCGIKAAEYTTASVSQVFNREEHRWDPVILNAFHLPKTIFPEITPSSTRLGLASRAILDKTGTTPFDICTVGQHDTASAVAAVPAMEEHFAYISSGTWSLMGIETDEMITSDVSFQKNLANEGGLGGKNRFLKNIMGLWILQQCRHQWKDSGISLTYEEIENAAAQAIPFRSIIDPDDSAFFQPGNMIGKIQSMCRETNQPIPETIGEISRCVLESLALTYRDTLGLLEEIEGYPIPVVHIIGGGSQSNTLNQMAASAMNRPVWAGPCEAAAIGNLCAQWIAAGEIKDVPEARQIIRQSFEIQEYTPGNHTQWDDAFERYKEIIAKRKSTG
jgi:sugar (pentulose or hexulose) kinase